MNYIMHTLTIRDSWGTEIRLEPEHTDDSDHPCVRFYLKIDRGTKAETELDVRIHDAEEIARWLLNSVFGEEHVKIEIALRDHDTPIGYDAQVAPSKPHPEAPDSEGLPRYGLRYNGPDQPLAVPMLDGYWTPWHLAEEAHKTAQKACQKTSKP